MRFGSKWTVESQSWKRQKQDFNLIFPTGCRNPFFKLAKSTAFSRAAHLSETSSGSLVQGHSLLLVWPVEPTHVMPDSQQLRSGASLFSARHANVSNLFSCDKASRSCFCNVSPENLGPRAQHFSTPGMVEPGWRLWPHDLLWQYTSNGNNLTLTKI